MQKMRLEYVDLRPHPRDPGDLPVKRERKYVRFIWGVETAFQVYRDTHMLPGDALELVPITDEDDGYIYTVEEGYRYYSLLSSFEGREFGFIIGMTIKEIEDKNMKLSFDKKDVYSISNAKKAEKLIGTYGYLGDSYDELEEAIKKGRQHRLETVDTDSDCEVHVVFGVPDRCNGGLFLPASAVKDRRSGYAPYTAQTFACMVGRIITYRELDDDDSTMKVLVTGIEYENERACLGPDTLSFSELFEGYEILNDGEWVPFGAKEE